MLLIISNSQDVTADYLVGKIGESGLKFLRLDTDTCLNNSQFEYRIASPELRVAGISHSPGQFSNVWYRRPEPLKRSAVEQTPEGKLAIDEWAAALEAFFAHIPTARWMNHPSSNVAASHKLEQLTTAAKIGFRVPRTIVTQDETSLKAFFEECSGKVIAKPMSTGYVERPRTDDDSLIYTNVVTDVHLRDLSDLANSPTLFQEYVPKAADVRITVVDQEIHSVELIARDSDGLQRCDIRRNNMTDVAYRTISLPADTEAALRALVRHYGLRFAAIDMAVTTRAEWVFFEINPNGQWAWLDLVGGQEIAHSFIRSFSK
jgi:hypothetical protein